MVSALHAIRSWTLRSTAGFVLITLMVLGSHTSSAEAIPYPARNAESNDCGRDHRDREHGDREHGDRGHDDRGRNDNDHDHRGRGHGRDHRDPDNPAAPGPGLQQMISVRVLPTAFLRIDKSGRVTAAATNTGCRPDEGDDVFVFRPDGSIESSTTIDVNDCDWRGDFSVPGRFQPQDCNGGQRRESRAGSHRSN